jgi:hypothetical protein
MRIFDLPRGAIEMTAIALAQENIDYQACNYD